MRADLSSLDTSFSESSNTADGRTEEILNANEKRQSRFWRTFVFLVIIGMAAITGSLVYILTEEQQTEMHEREFYEYSEEIVGNALRRLNQIGEDLERLASTISLFALETKQKWPQVTQPRFQSLMTGDDGSEVFFFMPLVSKQKLREWEKYAISNPWWKDMVTSTQTAADAVYPYDSTSDTSSSKADFIVWQYGPEVKSADLVMMNMMSHREFAHAADLSIKTRDVVMSAPLDGKFLSRHVADVDAKGEGAHSLMVCPIFESVKRSAKVVGAVASLVAWDRLFADSLPHNVKGLLVNVDGEDQRSFRFALNGTSAVRVYNDTVPANNPSRGVLLSTAQFDSHNVSYRAVEDQVNGFRYTLTVFPSGEFSSLNRSQKPLMYTAIAMAIFAVVSIAIICYDCKLRKQHVKVTNVAKRSNAVVASLFPSDVGKQLMKAAEARESLVRSPFLARDQAFSLLQNEMVDDQIAEFVPEVTVMFGDIVGFTHWASSREPSDVFTFLETVYGEFDKLALKHKVFKLETVGDCYVAVCGLPKPNSEHHIVMARFANQCLKRLWVLLEDLESEMGAGTTELGMRVGLHSGPVTAGVLRGERPRFQLFGDTMNTTARMEREGMADCIHMSDDTADLLTTSGYGHWVTPREDKIELKGKGRLQTFWLEIKKDESNRKDYDGGANRYGDHTDAPTETEFSLIGLSEPVHSVAFNKKSLEDDLCALLQNVVNHRQATVTKASSEAELDQAEQESLEANLLETTLGLVSLPGYCGGRKIAKARKVKTKLSTVVLEQLHDFIEAVESLYTNHAFHNFEHAKYVTKSTMLLLERLNDGQQFDKQSHKRTCGISFDPLSQLAIVFAALAHDVDHPGVSNTQLAKEGTTAGGSACSVAEQNSASITWKLFLQSSFKDLRRSIYTSVEELERFRHVMIRSILSTDVMDINLNRLRNKRWEEVFGPGRKATADAKATVAIEHLIQVADLSHTMHSWQVYRHWNMQLFLEMYTAHRDGRGPNPAEIWYTGEISFFDNFVIPLATKVKDCEVFGKGREEFLVKAEQNRSKWFEQGKETVMGLERFVTADSIL